MACCTDACMAADVVPLDAILAPRFCQGRSTFPHPSSDESFPQLAIQYVFALDGLPVALAPLPNPFRGCRG